MGHSADVLRPEGDHECVIENGSETNCLSIMISFFGQEWTTTTSSTPASTTRTSSRVCRTPALENWWVQNSTYGQFCLSARPGLTPQFFGWTLYPWCAWWEPTRRQLPFWDQLLVKVYYPVIYIFGYLLLFRGQRRLELAGSNHPLAMGWCYPKEVS